MKKSFLSILALLSLSITSTMALAHGGDNDHQWWSDHYKRWFDKYGDCGQYNNTDYDTCNSSKDEKQCDWDHRQHSCHAAGHENHDRQWWSDKYNRWFDKYGPCRQYDYTDYDTCNSSKDDLQCDWNRDHQTCYPARGH